MLAFSGVVKILRKEFTLASAASLQGNSPVKLATCVLISSADKCLSACDALSDCFFGNAYQANVDNPKEIAELPSLAPSAWDQ